LKVTEREIITTKILKGGFKLSYAKMKKYRVKKLIPGYKLGKKFGGKNLVAVPKPPMLQIKGCFEAIMVFYDEGLMLISWDDRLTELSFKDKFGRGREYTLGYFEWKPTEQIPLI